MWYDKHIIQNDSHQEVFYYPHKYQRCRRQIPRGKLKILINYIFKNKKYIKRRRNKNKKNRQESKIKIKNQIIIER